jgi:hypothetical protein
LILAMGSFVRIPAAMVRPPAPIASVASVGTALETLETLETDVQPAEKDPTPHTDAVVVVVLDGARWQEVLVATDPRFAAPKDRGVSAKDLMPNLHEMIEEGAVVGAPDHGPPMVATGPHFVSLPGYNEIFSGRSPSSCFDNDCPATHVPTIADEIRETSSDVAVFASWGPIVRAAALRPSDIVRSTGEVGTGAFRADRATADKALVYFREAHPTFMFLGLGEPDEYAHRSDYGGYLGSLRQADAILGELRGALSEMGDRGKSTSVFVTCDHGRSDDFRDHGGPWPESSRVWLVAAGGAIPARGAVESKQKHRLADITPTIRALLGLPADTEPTAGVVIDELLPLE